MRERGIGGVGNQDDWESIETNSVEVSIKEKWGCSPPFTHLGLSMNARHAPKVGSNPKDCKNYAHLLHKPAVFLHKMPKDITRSKNCQARGLLIPALRNRYLKHPSLVAKE